MDGETRVSSDEDSAVIGSTPSHQQQLSIDQKSVQASFSLNILPVEMLVRILTEADSVTRTRCQRVCRWWWTIMTSTKRLTEQLKVDVSVTPHQLMWPDSCAAEHGEAYFYYNPDPVVNRLACAVKNLLENADVASLHITAPSFLEDRRDNLAIKLDLHEWRVAHRYITHRGGGMDYRYDEAEEAEKVDSRMALILHNLHVSHADFRSLDYSDARLEFYRSVEFRGVHIVDLSLCEYTPYFEKSVASNDADGLRPRRPIPDHVIYPPSVRRCESCECPLEDGYRTPDINNYHRIMAEIAVSDPPLTAQEEDNFQAIMQTLSQRVIKELQWCCAMEFGVPEQVWTGGAVPALLKRLVIAHQENGDTWTEPPLTPPSGDDDLVDVEAGAPQSPDWADGYLNADGAAFWAD